MRLLSPTSFVYPKLLYRHINCLREIRVQDDSSFKFSELLIRLASPEDLKEKPEDKSIKSKNIFSDHMFKVEHRGLIGGWQFPQIVPFPNAALDKEAKVVQFATEIQESLKAFRGEDGRIRLFRPMLTLERMVRTAVRSSLPAFDAHEMLQCIRQLIRIDRSWVPCTQHGSLSIRPTLAEVNVDSKIDHLPIYLLYVILSPMKNPDVDASYSACTRAWHENMTSVCRPTIDCEKAVNKNGCQKVLWLYGEEECVAQLGDENVFMVYINSRGKRKIVTPPLDSFSSSGVTSSSILELCKKWDSLEVVERRITMKEIIDLQREGRLLELFGSSIDCVVCPLSSIVHENEELRIPTLEIDDPIYKRLYNALTDIQYGRTIHPWSMFI